jgi:hypothetical protein
MTTEHQTTREEKAYGRLLEEMEDMLSEAARTILSEAQSAAYALCMVYHYAFQFEEYDEAIEKMRLAAAKLTDSEHQLLAKIWRGALAAAASVDADDYETLAGYRAYSGDLHRYYRMVSGMIEDTLQAKKARRASEGTGRARTGRRFGASVLA